MGQRTNLLLQIEGRSGARLNRVYHLQWGYRKILPMAFLHLLSSRFWREYQKIGHNPITGDDIPTMRREVYVDYDLPNCPTAFY